MVLVHDVTVPIDHQILIFLAPSLHNFLPSSHTHIHIGNANQTFLFLSRSTLPRAHIWAWATCTCCIYTCMDMKSISIKNKKGQTFENVITTLYVQWCQRGEVFISNSKRIQFCTCWNYFCTGNLTPWGVCCKFIEFQSGKVKNYWSKELSYTTYIEIV